MGGLPWDVAARDLPVPEAISQRRAALGIPQATPRAQEAPPQAAKRGQGQACGDGQTAPDTQDQSTKTSKSVYNIISTQGWLTYQLRRLRLHGLIERAPGSHRYTVTDKGLRVALWFTRCHARLFRPALGELFAEDLPDDTPLRRALDRFDQEVNRYMEKARVLMAA